MPFQTRYTGIFSQSVDLNPYRQDQFNESVNEHLDAINRCESGCQLLNQISSLHSRRGHKLTIHELQDSEQPATEPILSINQQRRHPTATSFLDRRETAGQCYALKKRFGSNEGSSAIVSWSPQVAKIILDEDGDATGHGASSSTDKVSTLAHELVHAKHMMGGTWKGSYQSRRDPTTQAGKEELRAVGIGKYNYRRSHQPSENSVRAEYGLPKRKSYHPTGYRSDSD